MDSFNHSIGFVSANCRFCCSHPPLSPFISGGFGREHGRPRPLKRFILNTETLRCRDLVQREKSSVPLSLCVQSISRANKFERRMPMEFGSLGVFAAAGVWTVLQFYRTKYRSSLPLDLGRSACRELLNFLNSQTP